MNFKGLKKAMMAGTAASLMACSCIPALAGAPALSISKKEVAKIGDKVTVTITMDTSSGAESFGGDVKVSGLTINSVSGGVSSEAKVGLAPQLGTTATYECTVTADSFSFALENVAEYDLDTDTTTALSNVSVSGKVAATTPTTNDTNPTTTTKAPTTTTKSDTKKNPSKTSPKTGDMGAVQVIKEALN